MHFSVCGMLRYARCPTLSCHRSHLLHNAKTPTFSIQLFAARPTPPVTMHLHSLPAELRNAIYEHALTGPPSSDILFDMILDRLQNTRPSYVILLNGKPFNNLKNTCKQLRIETSGLELAFNTVVLESKRSTPAEQLRRLRKALIDADIARVLSIKIKKSVADKYAPFEGLNKLVMWCKQYPAIAIKYVLPKLVFALTLADFSSNFCLRITASDLPKGCYSPAATMNRFCAAVLSLQPSRRLARRPQCS